MVESSNKTSQAIRQEKLLADLQINQLIPKPGLIERMGAAANAISDTMMAGFSGFGPLSSTEKAMDSSRHAVRGIAEDMSRQASILNAADHVAKKRGDNLSFNQGGLPKEAHVTLAVEYLERALAEHKAATPSNHHFRNMVTLRKQQLQSPEAQAGFSLKP